MVEIEERGSVAIIRMVRGKGNALNVEFLEALLQAMDGLERAGACGDNHRARTCIRGRG